MKINFFKILRYVLFSIFLMYSTTTFANTIGHWGYIYTILERSTRTGISGYRFKTQTLDEGGELLKSVYKLNFSLGQSSPIGQFRPLPENLTLISPNGGEYWYMGSEHDIIWNFVNIPGNVRIEYSVDCGVTWDFIAEVPASSCSYTWEVPWIYDSDSCLIRVYDAYDMEPADTSDSAFTIYTFQINRDGWGFPNYYLDNFVHADPDSYFIYMWPNQCWENYSEYNRQFRRLTSIFNIRNSDFPSWTLWVAAFGEDQCYFDPPPGRVIYRPYAVFRWCLSRLVNHPPSQYPDSTNWWGSCLGMATSCYLFFDNLLNLEMFFPGYYRLFDVPVGDSCPLTCARQVANMYCTHGFGWQHINSLIERYILVTPNQTITEINEMLNSDQKIHRTLCIWPSPPSIPHFVNPVKITTNISPDSSHIKYIWVYDNIWPGTDTVYCCPGYPDTVQSDIPIRVRVDTILNSWSYIWGGDTGRGLFLMEPVDEYLSTPEMYIDLGGQNIGIIAYPAEEAFYQSTYLNYYFLDTCIAILGYPLMLQDEDWLCEYTHIRDSTFYFSLFTPEGTSFHCFRFDADSSQKEKIHYKGDGKTVALINPDVEAKRYHLCTIVSNVGTEIVYNLKNFEVDSAESTLCEIIPSVGIQIDNWGEEKLYDLGIEIADPQHDEVFLHRGVSHSAHSCYRILTDWLQNNGYLTILVDSGFTGTFTDTIWIKNEFIEIPGDCNGNNLVNFVDLVYLDEYLYNGGPAPTPLLSGDVNGDCDVTKADLIYLANYLFYGGPPPIPCELKFFSDELHKR